MLVSASQSTLAEIPAGAVIGTSSPRRTAQLRAFRSDVIVEPVRGNVETRIGRADGNGYEGVVVAAAGLLRLGLESRIAQYFDPYDMVPEPGQGALAVEVRSEREDLLRLLDAIRDARYLHGGRRRESICGGYGRRLPRADCGPRCIVNGDTVVNGRHGVIGRWKRDDQDPALPGCRRA